MPQKAGARTAASPRPRKAGTKTHNFAKTPLELHVGLALVMDAGFAVLASQRKLVVHWKRGSRIEQKHA